MLTPFDVRDAVGSVVSPASNERNSMPTASSITTARYHPSRSSVATTLDLDPQIRTPVVPNCTTQRHNNWLAIGFRAIRTTATTNCKVFQVVTSFWGPQARRKKYPFYFARRPLARPIPVGCCAVHVSLVSRGRSR